MFRRPVLLNETHRVENFDCGVPSLNSFLINHAFSNQVRGLSGTFVVTTSDNQVAAYYSLAHGAIYRSDIPKSFTRNTPPVIPVQIIGRFAVRKQDQSLGIGRSMLQDLVVRCIQVSADSAFMFVLVHPANPQAEQFWRHYGFIDSPSDEPMLLLPLHSLYAVSAELGDA